MYSRKLYKSEQNIQQYKILKLKFENITFQYFIYCLLKWSMK